MKIYYFSGTGNAKHTAYWLNEYAKSMGINSQVINIADSRGIPVEIAKDELTGFVSPTHGFNYPPVMLKFICRFPRAKCSNKVFLMNTRAGMKFGNIYFPGLSGIALLLSAVILWFKGYKIIGMQPVDLPSNWISLHPGLTEKASGEIITRCRKKVLNFAEKIFNDKKSFNALYDIVQDLLIAPVAVLYYCIGRFVFAKSFIASSRCDSCMACIKQCPVKAIKLIDGTPFWTYKCESCMKCMNNCPKRAIETAHGFVIGTVYIVNSILITYIYAKLKLHNAWFIVGNSFGSQVLRFVAEPALLIFILIISYRAIHYLKRIKTFEKLIVYTSLTKYGFWRRYKFPVKHKS
jgi:ferredoxin